MRKVTERFYIEDKSSILRFESTNYLKIPQQSNLEGVKRRLIRSKNNPDLRPKSRDERLRDVTRFQNILIESTIERYELVKTLNIETRILVLKHIKESFSECLLLLKEYLGFSIESLLDIAEQEIDLRINQNKEYYKGIQNDFVKGRFDGILTDEEEKLIKTPEQAINRGVRSLARNDIIRDYRLNYEKEISILASLEGLDNELMNAVYYAESQQNFIQQATNKDAPRLTLRDFITIDNEMSIINAIPHLLSNKKGKAVAILIEALKKENLLFISEGEYAKFYDTLRYLGYDIGSDQSINKQLLRSNQSTITEEELSAAVKNLTTVIRTEEVVLSCDNQKQL